MSTQSLTKRERPQTILTAQTACNVVVIGVPAGRMTQFMQLLHALPAHCPAALLAVVHAPADQSGQLAEALLPGCALDVAYAYDGDTLRPGRLAVAPPGARHLLVEPPGMVRLVFGPRENGVRPSIDVLFRSAARAFGTRVVGLLFSGDDADGLEGLSTIHAHGGRTIVQLPEHQATGDVHIGQIDLAQIDHLLPLAEIGGMLNHLTQGTAGEPVDSDVTRTSQPPEQPAPMSSDQRSAQRENEASGFVCPECHGALWETFDGPLLTYTCRSGHAWSDTRSLVASHGEDLERIAWQLVGALDERATLLRRLVALSNEPTAPETTQAERTAANALGLSRLIREALPTVL